LKSTNEGGRNIDVPPWRSFVEAGQSGWPSPGVLHADPGITIIGPVSVAQTIHVRDIESAPVKVAASDVQVPAEWEGVQLRTQIGPMVELNYPDGVYIVQTRPMELSIPSVLIRRSRFKLHSMSAKP
jgi:hypothetical protein